MSRHDRTVWSECCATSNHSKSFQSFSQITCFVNKLHEEDANTSVLEMVLNIIRHMQLNNLFPIQRWSFPAIMDGWDVIVRAPTGSGKTVCNTLADILCIFSWHI